MTLGVASPMREASEMAGKAAEHHRVDGAHAHTGQQR